MKKSVNNRDPNDSSNSEDSDNSPKNWGDVVERFNALNGEHGALSAQGILGGYGEAKRNLEMISKLNYKGKKYGNNNHYSSNSEEYLM